MKLPIDHAAHLIMEDPIISKASHGYAMAQVKERYGIDELPEDDMLPEHVYYWNAIASFHGTLCAAVGHHLGLAQKEHPIQDLKDVH
jgi:hypothetical protein